MGNEGILMKLIDGKWVGVKEDITKDKLNNLRVDVMQKIRKDIVDGKCQLFTYERKFY